MNCLAGAISAVWLITQKKLFKNTYEYLQLFCDVSQLRGLCLISVISVFLIFSSGVFFPISSIFSLFSFNLSSIFVQLLLQHMNVFHCVWLCVIVLHTVLLSCFADIRSLLSLYYYHYYYYYYCKVRFTGFFFLLLRLLILVLLFLVLLLLFLLLFSFLVLLLLHFLLLFFFFSS